MWRAAGTPSGMRSLDPSFLSSSSTSRPSCRLVCNRTSVTSEGKCLSRVRHRRAWLGQRLFKTFLGATNSRGLCCGPPSQWVPLSGFQPVPWSPRKEGKDWSRQRVAAAGAEGALPSPPSTGGVLVVTGIAPQPSQPAGSGATPLPGTLPLPACSPQPPTFFPLVLALCQTPHTLLLHRQMHMHGFLCVRNLLS